MNIIEALNKGAKIARNNWLDSKFVYKGKDTLHKSDQGYSAPYIPTISDLLSDNWKCLDEKPKEESWVVLYSREGVYDVQRSLIVYSKEAALDMIKDFKNHAYIVIGEPINVS